MTLDDIFLDVQRTKHVMFLFPTFHEAKKAMAKGPGAVVNFMTRQLGNVVMHFTHADLDHAMKHFCGQEFFTMYVLPGCSEKAVQYLSSRVRGIGSHMIMVEPPVPESSATM